jgi:hypothetical protein
METDNTTATGYSNGTITCHLWQDDDLAIAVDF